MCLIKNGGSTLASNRMQHTLVFSKARVTALIPIIIDFLKKQKYIKKSVESSKSQVIAWFQYRGYLQHALIRSSSFFF